MLVEAQDEISEFQITVITESQSTNSLMTPRDQLASSKSHSKALSTGKSNIGAASMVLNVESYENSAQSEVRGIAFSSDKISEVRGCSRKTLPYKNQNSG